MPCVGFEPAIPASERATRVHALDRSATATGSRRSLLSIKYEFHLSLQLPSPVVFRSNKNAASYGIITLEVQREKHVGLYVKDQSLLSDFKPNWYILVNVKYLSTSVGIANGYRFEGRSFGFRASVGVRSFSSPCRPDRFLGSPSFLYSGYHGLFPGGRATGA
jgi:hypothetical protein